MQQLITYAQYTFKYSTVMGKNFSNLAQGAMDFLISAEDEESTGFYRQVLYEDEFVCAVNENSPIAQHKKLTLADYLSLKHGRLFLLLACTHA